MKHAFWIPANNDARDFARVATLICALLFAGCAVICIRLAIVAGNF